MGDNTIVSYFPQANIAKNAETAITKYTAVKPGTSNKQVVPGTANSRNSGIASEGIAITKEGNIIIFGGAEAKLGDTVSTIMTALKSDSSAELVPVASNNDKIVAWALDTGVADDVIPVLVIPGFQGQ